MRITTKGRYAIRAIVNMAKNDEDKPISIKSISDREDLSPIFLEQIFTKLKKAGITESIRGASGGFRLAKPLDKISVLDVLEAVEEGVTLAPCTGEENCERSVDCGLANFWYETEQDIRKQLENRTIQDILTNYIKAS